MRYKVGKWSVGALLLMLSMLSSCAQVRGTAKNRRFGVALREVNGVLIRYKYVLPRDIDIWEAYPGGYIATIAYFDRWDTVDVVAHFEDGGELMGWKKVFVHRGMYCDADNWKNAEKQGWLFYYDKECNQPIDSVMTIVSWHRRRN